MTKYFNSSETLEMCNVHVSENGKMVVEPKSYHSDALSRLGTPEKTIRGRVKMEKQCFVFEPYAEASRKPTYKKQVVVGSTTVAVTEDKVKLSLVLSRNYSKEMLVRLIEAEMEEVLRRIEEDVYDSIVASHKNDNDNVNDNKNSHPDGKVNVNVSVNVEEKGGAA